MSKKQKTLFETWEKCSQKASTSYGTQAEDSLRRTNLTSLYNSDNNIFKSPSRNVSQLDANGFDPEAGKTWIYPTNYPVRDYQFSIVQEALFKNTLVILPTGLGKTFIAAVVMYNIYRWYPKGKVIFMAPTRPLVAQQVDACFKITGISLEDTTQMTGTNAPEERRRLWQKKRVFFLTPQVLSNDIVRNICPASSIKCVVVDEAHKAIGNHAFCQVIQELQSHTSHFRVLALTATPGSDTQAVKLVLANLLISHVEMRSEDSDDMKQYTHVRDIEKIVIPLGDRLTRLKSKFLDIINIYLKRLVQRRAMSSRNPSSLSKFQVLKIREDFSQHPPDNIDKFSYGLVMADFSLCISLYHAYELLLLHGARSFYNFLTGILNGEKSIPHARAELLKNSEFEELLSEVQDNYIPDCSTNEQNDRYSKKISPGHPKLEKLLAIVLNHFKSMKNTEKNTRVMIFSQYRDSVQEIVDMLNLHQPVIKCMSFIGQSSKSSTNLGYSQRHQLKVLQQFRSGGYNTLVSTCVGEEGLDIGEVDLIVCYDCPKSPIRLVQRMGRTGRLRKGRIVILITEGKEENMYNSCEKKKKSVNRAINKGFSFGQIFHKSPSLVPNGKLPVCIKTMITPDCETVKMKCKAKSSSKFLTPEELKEYNSLFKVPRCRTPLLLHSSFVSIKDTDKDGSDHHVPSEARFSLSKWMLWQTRPQRIHKVTHSSRTLLLTTVADQINFSPTLNTDNINEPVLHHSTQPIIDLCSEYNINSVMQGKTNEYLIEEKDSSTVHNFNIDESGPYLHSQSDTCEESKACKKKNLLSRLFSLNLLPTAVQCKLNLKSPPLISDLKTVESSISFKVNSLVTDKNKITSVVQILNKKMKAVLKRKMGELGINCSFTKYQLHNSCQKENIILHSPLFCKDNKSFDSNFKTDSNYELRKVLRSPKSNLNNDSVPIADRSDKSSIVPSFDISFDISPPRENCVINPIISSRNASMKTLEFDISFDIFQASSQFEEELEEPIKCPSLIKCQNHLSSTATGNNSNINNDASVIFDQLSFECNTPDKSDTTFSLPLKLKKVIHEKEYHDIYKKDKKISLPNLSIFKIPEPIISHKSFLCKENNSKDINEDQANQTDKDNLMLSKESSFMTTFKTTEICYQNSLENNSTPVVSVEGKSDVCEKGNWKIMNNCENPNTSQYSLTQILSFIENTEKFESLQNNIDTSHVDNPLDEALICESSDDEIEPTPPKESISEFLYRSNSINQDSNSMQYMENTQKDLGEKFSFDLSDIHFSSGGKNTAVTTGFKTADDSKSDVSAECFDKLFFDISFDLPDENVVTGIADNAAVCASRLHNSISDTKAESDEFKELDSPPTSCSILQGAVEMHSFSTKDECFEKSFSVSTKTDPSECKKVGAQQSKYESSLESKHDFEKSKFYNLEQHSEITTSSYCEKTAQFKESFTLPVNKEVKFRGNHINKPVSSKFMVASDKIDSTNFSVKECIESKSSFFKQFDPKEMEDFDVKFPKLPSLKNTKSFISTNNKANCKKFLESKSTAPTDKSFHERKRARKKCNLILSQADVSGSHYSESDYESNNEDCLEESFIDDISLNNHTSNQQGMYLQSIKNCVGLPQKFKLKMNVNHDSDPHSKENDSSNYLLDSFCVNDDEIVFSSSDEETLESRTMKSKTDIMKRKRIVIADDSSSSGDDAMVKKISRSVSKPLLEKGFHGKRKANFLSSSDEEENIVSISNCDNKPSKRISNDSSINNSIKFESSCCISNIPSNVNCDKNNSIAMKQVNDDLNNIELNNSFGINCVADTSSIEQNSNKVSACYFKISTSNCDMKLTSGKTDSNDNILTSNLSQPVSEKDKSLGNISESLKFDLHSDGNKKSLLNSIIHASGSYSNDLTILVDSRELAGGKPIISTLRNKYGINPVVMQLSTADYVISNRLAIKRVMDTEFQTIGMPPKVVDKVKSTCESYEKTFVIIQADCRKRVLGFNKLDTKHLQFSLQLNFHPAAKVLFTSSFDETSAMIFDIIQKEKMKGHLIDIPVIPSNQKLFDFYHSCPHVTPVCALRFTYHFPVVSMFLSSSVEELKKAGYISTRTAISIHEYLKSELLFDAFS